MHTISNVDSATMLRSVILPCARCRKGVDGNSILCIVYGNRVHKRCSGGMGNMSNLVNFISNV